MLSKGRAVISVIPLNSSSLQMPLFRVEIAFQGKTAGGPWTAEEQKNCTNIQELKVAKLAILTFTCMHQELKSNEYIVKMVGDAQ